MSEEQYDEAERLAKQICALVRDDLKEKEMELVDIKVEFGIVDGKVTLIDEISAGNMRVYKEGKNLNYIELSNLIVK